MATGVLVTTGVLDAIVVFVGVEVSVGGNGVCVAVGVSDGKGVLLGVEVSVGGKGVLLGEIGPAAVEAVPALIMALEEALEEYVYLVVNATAEALSLITGQDFGKDAAAWQEWWDAQQ